MEFIIAFFIFLLVVVAMAVGVIFGRKRIQGSCGGLSSVGVKFIKGGNHATYH